MTTHSEDYTKTMEDIAQSIATSFELAPEHNICVFRIKNEDRDKLDWQRVAQLIEDKMSEPISWKPMDRFEILLEGGFDLGEEDMVIVFRRDNVKGPEEES